MVQVSEELAALQDARWREQDAKAVRPVTSGAEVFRRL
jgi:hypothetical protein